MILWAAILASSMGFIDSSVTSIAIPAIRAALQASLPQAQWVEEDILGHLLTDLKIEIQALFFRLIAKTCR